jgi:hypothetical protein
MFPSLRHTVLCLSLLGVVACTPTSPILPEMFNPIAPALQEDELAPDVPPVQIAPEEGFWQTRKMSEAAPWEEE